MTDTYTPMEIAIAISLYGYNRSPYERAKSIHEHFGGHCMEMDELVEICSNVAYVATELPYPSAKVYVERALKIYGDEARERVAYNSR